MTNNELTQNTRNKDNQQGQRCHIAGYETEDTVETDADGAVVGEFVANIGIGHNPPKKDDGSQRAEGRKIYAVEFVDEIEEGEAGKFYMGERAEREREHHAQGSSKEEEEESTHNAGSADMLGEGGGKSLKKRDGTGEGSHGEQQEEQDGEDHACSPHGVENIGQDAEDETGATGGVEAATEHGGEDGQPCQNGDKGVAHGNPHGSFEDVFKINKDNWSITIKKGIQSAKNFKLNFDGNDIKIKLFYNLRFSDKSQYRSYSLAFRPDYTLMVTIGEHMHYIHFDAKYRSELEIIDFYSKIGKSDEELDEEINKRDELEEKEYVFKDGDIYKMHTYKDSILQTEGSYVLYPGSKTKRFRESEWIIPSVGAFSLTPGNDDIEEDNLAIFIKEVLKTLLFHYGLIPFSWNSVN